MVTCSFFCAGDFVASVYFSHVPPVSDIWLHFPIDDMYVAKTRDSMASAPCKT